MTQRKVLFLCTGNSCRSQLAEAIVNARLVYRWQAYSAGTKPAGYVHPLAIFVLSEIGIDHDGFSKSVEDFRQVEFDCVITLCDEAAEDCPLWLGKGKRVHIGFADPAKANGSPEEVLDAFRNTRDCISTQIIAYLEEEDKILDTLSNS